MSTDSQNHEESAAVCILFLIVLLFLILRLFFYFRQSSPSLLPFFFIFCSLNILSTRLLTIVSSSLTLQIKDLHPNSKCILYFSQILSLPVNRIERPLFLFEYQDPDADLSPARDPLE